MHAISDICFVLQCVSGIFPRRRSVDDIINRMDFSGPGFGPTGKCCQTDGRSSRSVRECDPCLDEARARMMLLKLRETQQDSRKRRDDSSREACEQDEREASEKLRR